MSATASSPSPFRPPVDRPRKRAVKKTTTIAAKTNQPQQPQQQQPLAPSPSNDIPSPVSVPDTVSDPLEASHFIVDVEPSQNQTQNQNQFQFPSQSQSQHELGLSYSMASFFSDPLDQFSLFPEEDNLSSSSQYPPPSPSSSFTASSSSSSSAAFPAPETQPVLPSKSSVEVIKASLVGIRMFQFLHEDGLVRKMTVYHLFQRFNLTVVTIHRIWLVCDVHRRNALSFSEFLLAIELVKRILRGLDPLQLSSVVNSVLHQVNSVMNVVTRISSASPPSPSPPTHLTPSSVA